MDTVVIKRCESKCNIVLVCTSSLFCFVGINGLLLWSEYFLGSTAICAGLVSINYWRDEKMYSLRHRLDVIVAKTSFISFILYGIKYINDEIDIIVYYCLMITFLYYMSMYCHYKFRNRLWMIPHVCFHLCGGAAQYFVISSCGKKHLLLLDN